VCNKRANWESKGANKQDVLVIEDGAGTRANKKVYDVLSKTYNVKFVRAGNRSFKYPTSWDKGTFGENKNDLSGFGHEIGRMILGDKFNPSVVVCGSRGGQIAMNVLLRHYWRGPFVCINAGVLTSNTPIPHEAFGVFLTFGNDEFPTKKLRYTIEKFNNLAPKGHRALVLRFRDVGHMPDTDTLFSVMEKCVQAAANRASVQELQSNMWPLDCVIYQVVSQTLVEKIWG
jgi:hypothetical protein